MPDRRFNRNHFNIREEEATPEELGDMAHNTISVLVIVAALLFLIALPFFN